MAIERNKLPEFIRVPLSTLDSTTTSDDQSTEVKPTEPATAGQHQACDKNQSPTRDAFMFYSDKENLRKALRFELEYKGDEPMNANKNVERKTRISFEMDPFTMMAEMMLEDEEFNNSDSNIDFLDLLLPMSDPEENMPDEQ